IGLVYICPTGGEITSGTLYFWMVLSVTLMISFCSTVQFVALGGFFSHISDPAIGGTYLTLLNTFSNLGGSWPKFFVLYFADALTESKCEGVTGWEKCSGTESKAKCLEEG